MVATGDSREHHCSGWENLTCVYHVIAVAGQNGVADTLQVITGGKSIWSVQPVKGTWVRDATYRS